MIDDHVFTRKNEKKTQTLLHSVRKNVTKSI